MKKAVVILVTIAAIMVAPMVALAQGPGEGGPIVEGNFGGSTNFGAMNPLRNNDTATNEYTDLLFPSVIGASPYTQDYARVGEDGVFSALATDWDVSEDGLVYTVSLRDDAKWSDGEPLTAEDVKFAFDAVASGQIDAPLYGWLNYDPAGNPLGISAINIIDDYTIEAVFEQASCTALGTVGSLRPVPAHVFGYDGSEDFDFSVMVDHEFDTGPSVAYGPFQFAQFIPGEAVSASAVTDWNEGPVIPSGFIYTDVPNQTVLVEQFLAGQTNYLEGAPVERRQDLREAPGVVVEDFPGNAWDYMAFNLADPENPQPGRDADGNPIDQGVHPIFSDVRVRRAIQHAINVPEIIEGAVFGEGSQMAANMIPTSWAYDSTLEAIAYDPDMAAQMLDEAGWPVGPDGVRVCQGCMYAEDGTPFEFTLITNQGNTRRESIGVIIQDALFELGINVDFQAVDFQTLLDTTFGAQTFDAFILGWQEGFPSDPDQIQLFHSGNDDPSNQASNVTSYYNPEFEELAVQANTVPGCDPEERAAIYHEIQRILQEDQPYVWLFVQNLMYAASEDVVNFEPYANVPMWNVHNWVISAQ